MSKGFMLPASTACSHADRPVVIHRSVLLYLFVNYSGRTAFLSEELLHRSVARVCKPDTGACPAAGPAPNPPKVQPPRPLSGRRDAGYEPPEEKSDRRIRRSYGRSRRNGANTSGEVRVWAVLRRNRIQGDSRAIAARPGESATARSTGWPFCRASVRLLSNRRKRRCVVCHARRWVRCL